MTVFAGDPILAADMNRAQQRVIGTPSIQTSDGPSVTATSNTLVDSITVPVEQGRRYKLSAIVPMTAVTADNAFFVLLLEDSVSGTQLVYGTFYASVANGGHVINVWTYWTAPTTGNKTFVLAVRRNGGTATAGQPRGSGGQPRTLTLEAAD
jgi:hypothetical protein